MIVSCQHVQKYYGANQVLSDVTFEIKEGDRVGLVGRNGAGKTTLLKLLTRESKPDGGQVMIRKGARIGSLAQIPDYGDATRVYDVLARGYADVIGWQEQMTCLEKRMTEQDVYEEEAKLQRVLREYEELREQFERAGGYEMEAQIERVARGLGIPQTQYQRPFASLSGGEKTKVGLASLLLERPTLLMLDEPTNHLDMRAIEWLEHFLAGYEGTIIVISHDRLFLDRVVTKVIDVEDGEATVYHANYTDFTREKEERLMLEFNAYQEQQKKIKKIEETIKQLLEWARRNPQNTKFPRRAASMQKALDRMQKLKRPVLDRKAMDLNLQQGDRSGKQVAVFEEVTKQYGERTLFTGLSQQLVYGERVFLIGDNGTGKSTLFKMLLGQVRPDAGQVQLGASVEVGYLAQEQAPQDETKTVIQFFRDHVAVEEGQARRELAKFLFYGEAVFKAVKGLSGGEWSRLRLALLMYQKPNLLLLDEPTNHLDIASREALEEALEEYPGTLLAISHDRYFINRLTQKIWALEGGELTSYLGNYDFYVEKRPERVVQEEIVEPVRVVEEAKPKVEAAPAENEPPKKKVNLVKKAKLEEQMAALEARLAELDAALADPANSADASKTADLFAAREAAQAELDVVFEQWAEMEE